MKSDGKTVMPPNGFDLSERFGEGWGFAPKLSVYFRGVRWLLRGFTSRFFFRRSAGLALIGPGVRIRNKSYLSVGRNFIAEDYCEISCHSKQGIVFGDKVTIGKFAIIRPSTLWGGTPGEGMRIGNNSNVGPYSYIFCSGFVEIGKNVIIAPRVSIYAENHNFHSNTAIRDLGVTRSFVKIEDDCWIASNAVILAGVTVGKGSVVAAGSVVTNDVPPYSVVAGVPAKVIKSRI